MQLKNTKTEENLRKALAGESIARNKYTYFADYARKNGNEEIALAFEEMAKNEMTHARFWFELLNGKPESVKQCLMQAAAGEYSEWKNMYPDFAAQAREEGLEEVAIMFDHVAHIERSHENRFMTLVAKLMQEDPVKAPAISEAEAPKERKKRHGYRCRFCGAIYDSKKDVCNVCKAIGSFDLVEYYE